jgi:hypothetical protein
MPTPGNCYQDSYEALQTAEPGWLLAHGYPRLARADGTHPAGSLYGHAWLELDADIGGYTLTVCRDILTDMTIPAAIFYKVGQIDPATVRRYTPAQAGAELVKAMHYGPWHPAPAGTVFGKE